MDGEDLSGMLGFLVECGYPEHEIVERLESEGFDHDEIMDAIHELFMDLDGGMIFDERGYGYFVI